MADKALSSIPERRKRAAKGEAQSFFQSALNFSSEVCLLWPFGQGTGNGYHPFSMNGTVIGVHRAICLEAHGPAPTAAHHAAHSCGNKRCVNPGHIRWATPSENLADKWVHGTMGAGERHYKSKVTADQVRQIRQLHSTGLYSLPQLGEMFGCSGKNIHRIVHRETWASVP